MRLQLLDILYHQYYQDYVDAQAEEIRMHLSALFSSTDIDHKSFKEEEITPELVAYANKLYFFSFFFLYSLETPWLAL